MPADQAWVDCRRCHDQLTDSPDGLCWCCIAELEGSPVIYQSVRVQPDQRGRGGRGPSGPGTAARRRLSRLRARWRAWRAYRRLAAAWIDDCELGGFRLSAASEAAIRARARLAVWDAEHGWPVPRQTEKPG